MIEENSNVPSILVCTGWQTTNIGDVAFTPAILSLLKKHVPEARVIAWVMNADEEIEALVRKNWPEVEWLRGELDSRGEPVTPALMAAFEQADLFLYNSGPLINYGYYNETWDWTVRAALPLFFRRTMGKPYGIYAQSFDRFAPPSEMVFGDLLSQADFIYTRETRSLEHLKEIGVKTPVLEFAPDADFGFDLRDDEKASAFLDAEGLEDQKFLVLNIRSINRQLEESGFRDTFMQQMREIMIRWVQETGLPVLIAPEQVREISAHGPLLVDPLPEDVKARVHTRDTWWLPNEAAAVFARARAVIGMEPHSLIMALADGVPILHPQYWGFGLKAQMFDDIGLGEWLFDMETQSSDEIFDVLLAVHQQYDAAREKVAEAMKFIRQREAAAMGVIRRVCLEAGVK